MCTIRLTNSSNLSILTNFGCPYNCSFCISSSQNSKNNYKFKLKDARDIKNLLKSGEFSRLSISGGGDPLFIHNKHIELLYSFIIKNSIKNNIELSFHTNFKKPPVGIVGLSEIKPKFVISIHEDDYLYKFHYWFWQVVSNKTGSNLRFTYVIGHNDNDLELIRDMLDKKPENAKLTLKQLDGTKLDEIKDIDKIRDLIKNNKKCIILESGDYNTYYNLQDNKIYDKFKDIKWHI